eukprot:m51a1_g429 hypothetical protein (1246) ;mRNA; r:32763-37263
MSVVVAKTVYSYLKAFVKNVSKQTDLNLFKGELLLRNIELNERALMYAMRLPLAFEVAEASCAALHVRVPWRSLKREPIRVQLDDVSVVVREAERPRDEPDADPLLDSLLRLKVSGSTGSKRGFVESLLEDARIDINNIRHELVAALPSISLHSTDAAWEEAKDLQAARASARAPAGQSVVHKVLRLGSVSVTITGHEVVQTDSLVGRFVVRRDSATGSLISVRGSVDLDSVSAAWHKESWADTARDAQLARALGPLFAYVPEGKKQEKKAPVAPAATPTPAEDADGVPPEALAGAEKELEEEVSKELAEFNHSSPAVPYEPDVEPLVQVAASLKRATITWGGVASAQVTDLSAAAIVELVTAASSAQKYYQASLSASVGDVSCGIPTEAPCGPEIIVPAAAGQKKRESVVDTSATLWFEAGDEDAAGGGSSSWTRMFKPARIEALASVRAMRVAIEISQLQRLLTFFLDSLKSLPFLLGGGGNGSSSSSNSSGDSASVSFSVHNVPMLWVADVCKCRLQIAGLEAALKPDWKTNQIPEPLPQIVARLGPVEALVEPTGLQELPFVSQVSSELTGEAFSRAQQAAASMNGHGPQGTTVLRGAIGQLWVGLVNESTKLEEPIVQAAGAACDVTVSKPSQLFGSVLGIAQHLVQPQQQQPSEHVQLSTVSGAVVVLPASVDVSRSKFVKVFTFLHKPTESALEQVKSLPLQLDTAVPKTVAEAKDALAELGARVSGICVPLLAHVRVQSDRISAAVSCPERSLKALLASLTQAHSFKDVTAAAWGFAQDRVDEADQEQARADIGSIDIEVDYNSTKREDASKPLLDTCVCATGVAALARVPSGSSDERCVLTVAPRAAIGGGGATDVVRAKLAVERLQPSGYKGKASLTVSGVVVDMLGNVPRDIRTALVRLFRWKTSQTEAAAAVEEAAAPAPATAASVASEQSSMGLELEVALCEVDVTRRTAEDAPPHITIHATTTEDGARGQMTTRIAQLEGDIAAKDAALGELGRKQEQLVADLEQRAREAKEAEAQAEGLRHDLERAADDHAKVFAVMQEKHPEAPITQLKEIMDGMNKNAAALEAERKQLQEELASLKASAAEELVRERKAAEEYRQGKEAEVEALRRELEDAKSALEAREAQLLSTQKVMGEFLEQQNTRAPETEQARAADDKKRTGWKTGFGSMFKKTSAGRPQEAHAVSPAPAPQHAAAPPAPSTPAAHAAPAAAAAENPHQSHAVPHRPPPPPPPK